LLRALDRALEASGPGRSGARRWWRANSCAGSAPRSSPDARLVTARGSGGTMAAVWLETRAHVSLTDVSLRSGCTHNGWLEIEMQGPAHWRRADRRVDLSVSGAMQTIR